MSRIPSRNISLTITLASNTQSNQPNQFAETGGNQVTISGLRTEVRVTNSGTPVATASVKVWGLTESLMNQLSTLGLIYNDVNRNLIMIQANDVGGVPSTVFQGAVFAAYGDYGSQPSVAFVMECSLAGADNVIPAKATIYPSTFDVSQGMQTLAQKMGYGFKNNGVSQKLPKSNFSGSYLQQARKLAEDAGIDWGFPTPNTLEIFPRGQAAQGGSVITISPATGMIGYPSFTQQGIVVRTLFNPQIVFKSLIKVQSTVLAQISQAKQQQGIQYPSQWMVTKLDQALDAYMPNGEWASICYAYNPVQAGSIQPPVA